MKILLVYPDYEETFWSFKKILKLLGKKAAFPPLGLLTISSMLPNNWEKKLIDMNTDVLKDEHIKWADYIFISAMIVQKESARKVIDRVKKFKKPVVAGGPLFTTGWEEFADVDHIFLGEVEEIFSDFIADLDKGKPKKIYSGNQFPDIKNTIIPDWSLIKINNYNSMCIQLSRGCPFNCEFCDVVLLNGRKPRIKSKGQLIKELEALYSQGWRAGVFFVDDNFIGNKALLKKIFLPAIIKWQEKRRYPFSFNTQVSIDLADDEELMQLMAKAGFTSVFIGIETPDSDGLEECGKIQNKNRDLIKSIKAIQNNGMEVQGGFIVGFDSDKSSIFQRQIEFIQKSGIVTAMVGLLTALPKTRLYQRLKEANRLLKNSTGDNTKAEVLNFIPRMDKEVLLNGYRKVVSTIYSPKVYYERVKTFLREYRPVKTKMPKIRIYHIRALISSIWLLGIKQKGRLYFWNLILWSLFRRPSLLPHAIGFSLAGIHFRAVS
ncbi:MAG: B12-binding domain-containing radical SAM protein [Actinomycetota bacterium]|nr:B12-binding domain-containing radical SAM protein [Actinomycetota bacterium]